jgi:Protein of unknown function (DUF2905)
MLKWIVTTAIALLLLTSLMPWLRRLGLGRLPGDVQMRIGGREVYLPFTTTILLSALLSLLGYLV